MLLYSVVAEHRTEHGPCSMVVKSTQDVRVAIWVAANIERLGYQFYREDSGVIVFRTDTSAPPMPPSKDGFWGESTPEFPWIYRRIAREGELIAEFAAPDTLERIHEQEVLYLQRVA